MLKNIVQSNVLYAEKLKGYCGFIPDLRSTRCVRLDMFFELMPNQFIISRALVHEDNASVLYVSSYTFRYTYMYSAFKNIYFWSHIRSATLLIYICWLCVYGCCFFFPIRPINHDLLTRSILWRRVGLPSSANSAAMARRSAAGMVCALQGRRSRARPSREDNTMEARCSPRPAARRSRLVVAAAAAALPFSRSVRVLPLGMMPFPSRTDGDRVCSGGARRRTTRI